MLITEIMMKLVEIVTTIQFFGIILLLHILTLLSKFKPGSCLPVTYEHKSFSINRLVYEIPFSINVVIGKGISRITKLLLPPPHFQP